MVNLIFENVDWGFLIFFSSFLQLHLQFGIVSS